MPKPLSEPHIKAILDELRRGEDHARIARRHGATKQAVSLIAIKHGLRRYRRRKAAELSGIRQRSTP
jgi:hypothetical protein